MKQRELSSKCLDPTTGWPRWTYPSAKAAQSDAAEEGVATGSILEPAHCEVCGLYHLVVVGERGAVDGACNCTANGGRAKRAYPSREAADATAEFRSQSEGKQLWPYRCPSGNGWHLTKNAPQRQGRRLRA